MQKKDYYDAIFDRRSALRGMGAGVFLLLPMLRTLRAESQGGPVPKLVCYYAPHGVVKDWTPSLVGGSIRFTPSHQALGPIASDVTVLRNLNLHWKPPSTNAHAASVAAAWTGFPNLEGARKSAEGSFDQLIAFNWKDQVPLPSLLIEVAPGTTYEYAMSFQWPSGVANNLNKNPALIHSFLSARIAPQAGPTPSANSKRILDAKKSVVDFVLDDVNKLRARIPSDEQQRLDAYLGLIRNYEKSLSDGPLSDTKAPMCKAIGPAAAESDFRKRSLVMIDLLATAFSCGLTRVCMFSVGNGENHGDITAVHPLLKDWHGISHYKGNKEYTEATMAGTNFVSGEFAAIVQKLRSIPDSGGTLLNNTALVWMAQNGDSNDHDPLNTPLIMAGGAALGMKGNRIIDVGGKAQNDVYRTLANAWGINIQRFGEAGWNRGNIANLIK